MRRPRARARPGGWASPRGFAQRRHAHGRAGTRLRPHGGTRALTAPWAAGDPRGERAEGRETAGTTRPGGGRPWTARRWRRERIPVHARQRPPHGPELRSALAPAIRGVPLPAGGDPRPADAARACARERAVRDRRTILTDGSPGVLGRRALP